MFLIAQGEKLFRAKSSTSSEFLTKLAADWLCGCGRFIFLSLLCRYLIVCTVHAVTLLAMQGGGGLEVNQEIDIDVPNCQD